MLTSMKEHFRKISSRASTLAGSAGVFILAAISIVIWFISGPIFSFSDTWQLVINTGTTIVTFLMVFLIQNTQNRDSKAIQLKLDELIRSTKGARMRYVGLEDFSDEDLADIEEEIRAITQLPASQRALRKLLDKISTEMERRRNDKQHKLHFWHSIKFLLEYYSYEKQYSPTRLSPGRI